MKKLQETFKGTQTAANKFLKPLINATAPVLGMALAANSKNPAVGEVNKNILKSIGDRMVLSLTDSHGNGLRLQDMSFHFK